jgi:hypothetical protein
MTKPPNFHLIDYDLLDKRDLEVEVPQQQCNRCDYIRSEGKFDQQTELIKLIQTATDIKAVQTYLFEKKLNCVKDIIL